MNAYCYPYDKDKHDKKCARSAANMVALATLVSTAAGILFVVFATLAEPYVSEFVSEWLNESFGGSRIFSRAAGEGFVISSEYGWFLSVVSTLLCSFLPFALLSKALFKLELSQAAPMKGKIMKSFPFVYCASVMMSGVAASVTGGIFTFFFPDAYSVAVSDTVDIYGSSESIYSLILCFLAMCVVAPFVEEFIYRGVIFGYLRRFGFSFAAFASSLIFGIAHATLEQIAYAFIFGLVMCTVYERTGNLKTSLIMHFVNNLVGYMQAYILPLTGSEDALVIFETVYNIFVGVFAVVGMIILLGGRKKDDSDSTDNDGQAVSERETVNVPISCVICTGTVLVILYSVLNLLMGMMANG